MQAHLIQDALNFPCLNRKAEGLLHLRSLSSWWQEKSRFSSASKAAARWAERKSSHKYLWANVEEDWKQTTTAQANTAASPYIIHLHSAHARPSGAALPFPQCSWWWRSQAPQWQNLQNLTSTLCKHRCLTLSIHITKVFQGQSALGRIQQKLHSYVSSHQIGPFVLT